MTLAAFVLVVAALPIASAVDTTKSGYEPRDVRNFSWVKEGVIAVGGGGLVEADVATLKELGFGAVANFRDEHEDPEAAIRAAGMGYLYIPIDSAADMNTTQLRTFIAWAEEEERAGRVVYAHCTNGWHRAATFVAAWQMKRDGLSFDQAAEIAEDRRWGTQMRATSALLAWQAELTGKPGLAVIMSAPKGRPDPDAPLPVTVQVLANGKPAAGATVKAWTESGKFERAGTADAEGKFRFEFPFAPDKFMAHLYARASYQGFTDGADNVEIYYKYDPPSPDGLDVDAKLVDGGVLVKVTKNGKAHAARVWALAPDGKFDFDSTATGSTFLSVGNAPGKIQVRAERWGLAHASTEVVREAGKEPPTKVPPTATPTPKVTPSPTPTLRPTPTPTPPPAGSEGEKGFLAQVPGAGALALLAALASAAALGAAPRLRRR